jgi:hypothetical protein
MRPPEATLRGGQIAQRERGTDAGRRKQAFVIARENYGARVEPELVTELRQGR